jgi:hypothetical protein
MDETTQCSICSAAMPTACSALGKGTAVFGPDRGVRHVPGGTPGSDM